MLHSLTIDLPALFSAMKSREMNLVHGKKKGTSSKFGCYYPWATPLACIGAAAGRLKLPMKDQLTKCVLHYQPNTVSGVGNLPEHIDKVRSRSLLLPLSLSHSLSLSLSAASV
jgi:hypothetical protein